MALAELTALVMLKRSVSRYAKYWHSVSDEGQFTYVVLGDSAAQAVGASSPEKGYVYLIARRVEQKTGKKVRIVNLSVSGAKVRDVLEKQIPELKNYKADLVTVEVGANDVVSGDTNSFGKTYDELTKALPKGSFVADIAYFGGRVRKNGQALSLNKYIHESVQKNDLKLVNLQQETHDRQSLRNYGADLFHPSNHGYEAWADAFWKQIEPTI